MKPIRISNQREEVRLGQPRAYLYAFFAILSLLFPLGLQYRSVAAEPPNSNSATNPTPFKPKPMMVAVTNRTHTLIGFTGHRAFPYSDGNFVTIRQVKAAPPGGTETRTHLCVVNMFAENLTEILNRLGTETIELAIYSGSNIVSTYQERNQPEREVILELGFAVITDTRIPREWFMSHPTLCNPNFVKADDILAAFPLSFKPTRTD